MNYAAKPFIEHFLTTLKSAQPLKICLHLSESAQGLLAIYKSAEEFEG